MTEEIIIDGIDVAGCVRLQDDKISCDLGGECKGWDNCYYKQLKRLEFELKVTKADYEASEQENKELKEKIKKYSAINEQDTKDYVILRKVLVRIQTIINEVLNG